MKKSDFYVRKADIMELENIIEIYKKAIKHMRLNGIDQWDEIYPNRNIIESDIKSCNMYIIGNSSDIIGAFTVNHEYDEEYVNGNWCGNVELCRIIHRLCISPQYQNCGAASFAIKYIEVELQKMNIHSVRLDAFSENKLALRLYEKLGYKRVGFADWRKGRFYLYEKLL